jgi:hypothetical protein
VLLSVALVVEQLESHTQGGVQVITRQMIGPRQVTSLPHWPYRKEVQQALRFLQLLFPHSQLQLAQVREQSPEPPLVQPLHDALQSM